jgi:hypothetical protein
MSGHSYRFEAHRFEKEGGQFYNWVEFSFVNDSGRMQYAAFKSYGGRGKSYRKDPIVFGSGEAMNAYYTKVRDGKLSDGYRKSRNIGSRAWGSAEATLAWLTSPETSTGSWGDALELSRPDIIKYMIETGGMSLAVGEKGPLTAEDFADLEPQPTPQEILANLPPMIGSW